MDGNGNYETVNNYFNEIACEDAPDVDIQSFGIAADTPGVCITCGQECGICKCDSPIVF